MRVRNEKLKCTGGARRPRAVVGADETRCDDRATQAARGLCGLGAHMHAHMHMHMHVHVHYTCNMHCTYTLLHAHLR